MSEKIKYGVPAFPTKMPSIDPRECGFYTNEGMSLCDWFAGMAMQGLLASGTNDNVGVSSIVKHAYAISEAMMAIREVAQ